MGTPGRRIPGGAYTLRFTVINQTSGEELNIELSDMIAIDFGDLYD